MYTRMSGSGFYNGSISAERGSIYDSKGEVLAQNVAAYTITACLDEEMEGANGEQLYVSDYRGTAEKRASVLGDAVDVDTLVQTMQTAKNAGRDQTELGTGTKRISKEQKEAIEELQLPASTLSKQAPAAIPPGYLPRICLALRPTMRKNSGSWERWAWSRRWRNTCAEKTAPASISLPQTAVSCQGHAGWRNRR